MATPAAAARVRAKAEGIRNFFTGSLERMVGSPDDIAR
jgi:hypothetical protein